MIMAASILNKIEYLCEKHYGIMHTLSLEENLQTLQAYCQKKGGTL